MKNIFLIILVFISITFTLSAQNVEDLNVYRPKFEYKAPIENKIEKKTQKEEIKAVSDITSKINETLDTIAVKNKKIKYAHGFRILVYSGKSKEEVKKVKEKVYSIYPDIDIYQIYKQPDYKIKVGDYTNRFEAYQVLTELKSVFPDALMTMEQVNIIRPSAGQ